MGRQHNQLVVNIMSFARCCRYSPTSLLAVSGRLSSIGRSQSISTTNIALNDGERPYRPPRRRGGMVTFRRFRDEINLDSPWSSVWQGPRAFDPFNMPFPIHMGYPLKGEHPPPPVGNLELMKIPNFLHLTPPAIHKHCAALKPLCTPWPENIPPMPLKVETRNYVFPSHSVRHPGSKQVSIVFNLSDLNLSERARNKMIRLAGRRYKPEKEVIRLYAGRCPTRKQNYEYAMYLLKVLYLESNRVEPWELEDEDVEE